MGATHKRKSGEGPVTVCEHTHEDLAPGQTVRYRVAAVNIGPSEKMSDWSDTATLTTQKSTKPDKPEGLEAEAMGHGAINLLWNIQSRIPPAAPILAYIVEYLDNNDEWMQLARIADTDAADNQNGNVRTIYTDTSLTAGTARTYRVRSQNEPEAGVLVASEESDNAMATTDDAMVPGAPTASATADSDTQITVSWTAPADNGGADITSYIAERAYGGSFFDHADADGDVFTDAQTWWDGLGCEAMVEAVMDSGTADDTNPYCKMYADLGDAEEMEVERVFGVRYVVHTDLANLSITDSDLMPVTEYMYRVKAVNTAGAGMWSNIATATTTATDTALGDAMGLTSGPTEDNDPGSIKLSWTAGANANIHWIAVVRMDANGDFDVDNSIWTQASAQDSHTVDMEGGGLIPGEYLAMVIAGMNDSTAGTTQWSIWQSTTFTYGQ